MSAAPHARALALILCFASCAKEAEQEGAGPLPDGGLPAPVENAITGTKVDIYLSQMGDVKLPVGPDRLKVAALVPMASGGFTTIEGTVKADGSFIIPGVPQGPYYLRQENKYLWAPDWFTSFMVTSERVLDLSDMNVGRPDLVVATRQPTNLIINATGLSPFRGDDNLMYYSQGADVMEDDIAWQSRDSFVDASRLFGVTIDITKFSYGNLVEGRKGDTVLLAHLSAHVPDPDQALGYSAVTEVMEPAPFTQEDGQAVTISGEFRSVPQKRVDLTWNMAKFAALAGDTGPGASVSHHHLRVEANPGGPGRISGISFAPSLLRGGMPGGDDQDRTFRLSYGNPFPASWLVTASIYTTFQGQDVPDDIKGTVGLNLPFDSVLDGPVSPALSPPRGLKVNGQPAQGPLSGIGPNAVVSWEAPALGTPEIYQVNIYQQKPANDYWDAVTTISSREPTVTIPPGYLTPGTPVYLKVLASSAHDPQRPRRSHDLRAWASTVSGRLTP